jgi:DNA-binding MarR family transcriptional regulator/GNAT superfamily N-acetyltransferase
VGQVTATVRVERVAGVRSFNRFYTGVIGVLTDGLLHTPYSLTEARVLFELAQADQSEVPALRRALDLDPGYLSRILGRFEVDGLVTRGRSPRDARRQVVALTPAGRAAYATLDARSTEEIGGLLGRLDEGDQRRLLDAMGTIERLLGAGAKTGAVVLRPPTAGELGWVVQRHGEVYAEEYGWNSDFEAMVARIVADYAAGHEPEREAAWIAEVDGVPVGCVFCVRRDDETAQLRVLLVEPGARGMGLGGRLVDECVRFARDAGYRRIVLFTYDVLVAASRIYERAGFRLAGARAERSYGHDLVAQWWERDLP